METMKTNANRGLNVLVALLVSAGMEPDLSRISVPLLPERATDLDSPARERRDIRP
jgi:hypothetical protein